MLFRNLTVYRIANAIDLEGLSDKLAERGFTPCAPTELSRSGFSPAMQGWSMAHESSGAMLLSLKQEEKVIPGPVLREKVAEKMAEQEEAKGRKLRKPERQQVKEEVTITLAPQAFSRHKRTWAYIDRKAGFLVIDAASAKQVDQFLIELDDAWGGGFPVAPLETNNSPGAVMTRWLQGEALPEELELGEEAFLEDAHGSEVRVKRQDLTAGEIRRHLEAGKSVRRLAVTYAGRISGLLDIDLNFRRVRFMDAVKQERSNFDTETEADQLDADFSLMVLEQRALLEKLPEWFGGLQDRAGD